MKEQKKEIQIIVGDYGSQEKSSLLARCEKIKSGHDGMLHAGVIHYIQGRATEEEGFHGFILKAAIGRVLDKTPSVWPENLPELIKDGKEPKITKSIKKEFQKLNENLLIPIQGLEIAKIIGWAKKFLKENETSKDAKCYEKSKI